MKNRLCTGEQHDISKDVAGAHFNKLSHTVHSLISVDITFWHHSLCFHDRGRNFAQDAATVACTVLYSVFWNKSKNHLKAVFSTYLMSVKGAWHLGISTGFGQRPTGIRQQPCHHMHKILPTLPLPQFFLRDLVSFSRARLHLNMPAYCRDHRLAGLFLDMRSHHDKMWWSLEAARFGFSLFQWLWKLTRYRQQRSWLSNFRALL